MIPRAGWNNSSLRNPPRDADAVPPRTANFQLEAEHRIRGIVVDEQGRPIPGVQVTARTAVEGFHSSFSSPSPALTIPGTGASATTNRSGRFRLTGLPAEQVQLNLRSPHRHVNDANYPVDQECQIVMRGSGRAGMIRVKVLDGDTEKPVPTFTVTRRHDPKPRTFKSPEGLFELKDDVTEGGRYLLYIYSKDHAPAVLDIRAMPLDSTEEDLLELEKGQPLLGRLIDAESGEPLAGIPALYGVMDEEKTSYFEWRDLDRYVDGYHQLTSVQRAVTDDGGRFWFSESPDQPKGTLFILAAGYERMILRPSDRPEADGAGQVSIKLYPEATISGVLRKAYPTQADASVSVWKSDPRTRPEESFESCLADAQGNYRIRSLGPGTYEVSYWTSPSRSVLIPKRFATVTISRSEQKVLEPASMSESDQRGRHP
jgi:protocatechuate 3,4-dioxygenase beta subunit